MEQRTLRLGDLVDDYCPRERRVTNHAIVALVGEAIRQTRCMTCDSEHVFKAGRLPRRRGKDADAVVRPGENGQPEVRDVVTDDSSARMEATAPAGAERGDLAPAPRQAQGALSESRNASEGVAVFAPLDDAHGALSDNRRAGAEATQVPEEEDRPEPMWPANRTLIRAQLPRVEGEQPPPRPIPEFTIYQRNTGRHAGGFRRGGGGGGGGWAARGGQEPNGNRGGNDRRNGHAGGAGFGTGQGQGQGRRHGKRRPR